MATAVPSAALPVTASDPPPVMVRSAALDSAALGSTAVVYVAGSVSRFVVPSASTTMTSAAAVTDTLRADPKRLRAVAADLLGQADRLAAKFPDSPSVAAGWLVGALAAAKRDEFADVLTKDAAFPKRMGRPEEYGKLAVAIVENPMLNGSCIRLDAGQRFAPK